MSNNSRGNIFLGLLVIIGILLFAIWYIRSPYFKGFNFGGDTEISQEEEAELIENGTVHTIEITQKGFVPELLSIERYDTVTFLNRDSIQHQPVLTGQSNEESCVGFGSPRAILQNESYSYIFTKEGECGFGDSNSLFPEGKITISALER